MKIILSVEAIKYPLTGIGRYSFELAQRLGAVDDVDHLRYYGSGALLDAIPSAQNVSASSIGNPSLINRAKRFLARSQLVVDTYRFVRGIEIKSVLEGMEDHLFHGPNFYLPAFKGPSVVTVHDISFLTYPEFHPRERVLLLQKEIQSSLKQATRIVTDSDFIRDEIIAYFGLDDDRVQVAKLACDEAFCPRGEADVASVLDAYGLSYQSFGLYTGTIEPRKNLANLIDAYGLLPDDIKMACPLVLAGFKGWNNQAIMERIEAGKAEGWVKYLGYVPNDHLPLLYAGARLFTFPSVYEGFGLPVLEAMASGVPVLTANRASLPEVGGQAVAYVEPDDIGSIRAGLEVGLSDSDWRAKAISEGLLQAAGFSWDQCARDTAAIYRSAIEAHDSHGPIRQ